jgi:hypothetical protein
MVGLKEKAGVLPEVELDNYSSVLSGVARIDVDPSSGTVRVVPTIVDSCLGVPDGALPAYRPSEIVYECRRYILKEPLDCEVTRGLDGFYGISYKPFSIWGSGESMSECVEEFSYQFAHTYARFNELGYSRLCHVYQDVLRKMNESVLEVVPAGVPSGLLGH